MKAIHFHGANSLRDREKHTGHEGGAPPLRSENLLPAWYNQQAALKDLVSFFDHVNEEDRFVVEGIFKGAHGALAKAGPLSYLEREIHDFQKYLVSKLCPEKADAAKVAAE